MQRVNPFVRSVLPVTLALAIVACFAVVASACPTCKEDLASNPQGRGLAAGFYYSVLFMMSMPFLILGTLGTVAYRSIKRAEASRASAAAAS